MYFQTAFLLSTSAGAVARCSPVLGEAEQRGDRQLAGVRLGARPPGRRGRCSLREPPPGRRFHMRQEKLSHDLSRLQRPPPYPGVCQGPVASLEGRLTSQQVGGLQGVGLRSLLGGGSPCDLLAPAGLLSPSTLPGVNPRIPVTWDCGLARWAARRQAWRAPAALPHNRAVSLGSTGLSSPCPSS